ncbi:peptidoglycan bridge formation glycyltransferase FemA/FemB family protein [Arthrobacter frigidicola]|nr:peptidoglycan bridge formation glycyltransferase FemA/FemB family protein [Arthrobacter frigidicola]
MSAASFRYEKLGPEDFDRLVGGYPDVVVPLEQTPDWAGFETALGRRPYGIWAYYDGETLVAVASYLLIQRRLRTSLVVVNGPVWFAERTPAAERTLMTTVLSQFAADSGVDPLYIRMQVSTPQPPAEGPLEHGWFEREIVVDLAPEEKDLFRSFKPNARNSIRRAQKSGVEVRSIPRELWSETFRQDLFPIMRETAERDGFESFASDYYETLLTELGDYLRLLVAYLDGKPVSWLITSEYRGSAVYYFAGSTQQARKIFAPYLLLWEAFRELKAAGNRTCALTGIVSENYPQLANVTTFKRNFSKNVVVVPTTYDLPVKPLQYRTLGAALRARRSLPGQVRAARKALAAARGTIAAKVGPATAAPAQPGTDVQPATDVQPNTDVQPATDARPA